MNERERKKMRAARPIEYLNHTIAAMRADCRAAVEEVRSTRDRAVLEVPAAMVGALIQWLDTSHTNTERQGMPVTEQRHALRIADAYWSYADWNAEGVVVPFDYRPPAAKKASSEHA